MGRPLRAYELGGVFTRAQLPLDDGALVVANLDDALGEPILEVQVFFPKGQDVFLADVTADSVGVEVAHHAEIGIDGCAELLEQGHTPGVSLCFWHRVVLLHRVDEVAACAVGDVDAAGANKTRSLRRVKGTEEEFEKFPAVDCAVEAPIHPLVQRQDPVEPGRLVARWFDYRADHLRSLGVVLEIDFIRVKSETEFSPEELFGLGY